MRGESRRVGSGAGQDFGQVNGFKFLVLPAQETLEMHQTTGVVRNQVLRPGVEGRGGFGFAHCGGNHRKFNGEGAAEPAATGSIVHLDQRQVFHPLQQLARLMFNMQLTQAMAAIMKGDLGGEPAPKVGHPQLIHQERGKLENPPAQLERGLGLHRFAKKLWVKIFDHRCAGAGGYHHRIRPRQSLRDPGGDPTGFLPVPAIERRLAATKNSLLKINRVPKFFKNAHRAYTHCREQLVHKTGDKKDDFQRRKASIKPPSTVITWPVVLPSRFVSSTIESFGLIGRGDRGPGQSAVGIELRELRGQGVGRLILRVRNLVLG